MKAPMKKAPAKRPSKKVATDMPMPVGISRSDEMNYRAKDALHTLKRAQEIQQDPALMAQVQKHAESERDLLKKIARKGRA